MLGIGWSNYHGHSNYCDGHGNLEEYVKQAIKLGIKTLGISSHAPLPFETKWSMPVEKLPDYMADMLSLKQKYAGEIELYTGLEVDYIPDVMSPHHPSVQALALDYTVGSVHYVDAFPDGVPFEADGSREVFINAIHQMFDGDERKLVSRYFELVQHMLRDAQPTILGHLDKIKIHNSKGKVFDEGADWYRKLVQETLDVAATSGTILEVNTRGIYKKKCSETYPSPWILKQAYERGISITLNSDAHHIREITGAFEQAAHTIKACGYRHILQLHGGEWIEWKL